MKTIVLALSDEQFACLTRAAERRDEAPSELVMARLIDLIDDPADPFHTKSKRRCERDEEFLRRIA